MAKTYKNIRTGAIEVFGGGKKPGKHSVPITKEKKDKNGKDNKPQGKPSKSSNG